MRKSTKLLFTFVCVLFLQNCTDDEFNSGNNPNPDIEAEALRDQQFQSENFGNATTGKFIGSVTDVSGNKLQNVQITIGNTVTLTDRNGFFILNDVAVFENFGYIKAQKEGYIKGSRVVIPKANGVNRIDIVLLKKEITGTVTSGATSQVSLSNGAKVSFSGGFVKQDGSEYTGQVDVVLHYIEPNSILNTFRQMPGSLLAQTEANDARNLETYGMLSVNLFSPSGESLNINENSPATLEFPVHVSQTSIAPETIKLWYFDEAQGYWKEEGQAVKTGDRYIAEVTHFTWWNCDIPFDPIELCFNLAPANTSSTTPYYVIIKRVSTDQFIFFGNVTSGEFECGLIPINEEISVSIYQLAGSCFGQLIDTQIMGGYASDTSVEISFNESVDLLTTTITGMANNCDGNPITNGYLYVDEYNTFAITNGTINVGLQHCGIQTTTIQLFDFDTSQWAILDNVPLNGVSFNVGALSTCEDTGGIYNGDVTLLSQADVNNLSTVEFSTINGDLYIGDFNRILSSDITDLSSLSSLQNITGSLYIILNPNLQSLQGLQNLTETANITISRNNALTSLDALGNLTNTNSLGITNNSQLTSIIGISNLATLSSLRVENNPVLASLEGLENITSLGGGIVMKNNDLIPNLLPLSNLTELSDLFLSGNPSITSLEGLEQITEMRYLWIYDNSALTSLNGLENLIFMTPVGLPSIAIGTEPTDYGGFAPEPNESLVDFCALQNLFTNGNGLNLEVYIENNPFNPTPQDIIAGNCSQ